MTTTGWILMLAMWSGITALLSYCLYRVLRTHTPEEGPFPLGNTDGEDKG